MTAPQSPFSDSLIQAINDWQIGGNLDMKRVRGRALKRECAALDMRFRTTALVCFRRIALVKSLVWELHDQLRLAETVSAWTLLTDVARGLKGGVPADKSVPGLILEVVPPAGSVVVNLAALYRDPDFVSAHEDARTRIDNYDLGIGAYGDSQYEVVLELESVPMSAAYALGGHSSDRTELARLYFGGSPTPDQLSEFDALLTSSGESLGPRWIVGAAKDRVLQRTLVHHGIIKARAGSNAKT